MDWRRGEYIISGVFDIYIYVTYTPNSARVNYRFPIRRGSRAAFKGSNDISEDHLKLSITDKSDIDIDIDIDIEVQGAPK